MLKIASLVEVEVVSVGNTLTGKGDIVLNGIVTSWGEAN
jgi:hypothetical protein